MKNYTVSVPVNCMNLEELGREAILSKLRDLDARRVFLNFEETTRSGEVYFADPARHALQMEKLRSAAAFFKSEGYEVAAWFWGLRMDAALPFTRLCDLSGKSIEPFACPADPAFIAFAANTIADIARCGVDMIVFNDDLRYGFFSDECCCLCENHRNRIAALTGEALPREQLWEKILHSSANPHRNAFLQANKEALLSFARAMRAAADAVNPALRMGFCAAMSSWDLDGDAYELAAALAGKTRPLIRLIGAPYWAVDRSWGNRLQDVIELTRMEAAYFEGKEIELIAEGDVWPRPRTKCPAAFLEGYDLALRATHRLDGILKIALDYTAAPDYENGYVQFHLRNKPLYRAMEAAFAGKKSAGVRVYEFTEKLRNMKNPNELGEEYKPDLLFFSEAARTLACNGIPTTYEGMDQPGIAFGENARTLPRVALKNGMILDLAAAAILNDRGIDTGITAFGKETPVLSETFLNDQNRIIGFHSPAYEIELNEKATVWSIGHAPEGELPLSFTYTNAANERFLILNINPRKKEHLMRHYARGRQYAAFLGAGCPATCVGNPDTYLLCAEDEAETAVAVWNFSIDPALKPIVRLAREYRQIRFAAGGGRLCGDRVELEEIPPFGCAVFLLKK